MSTIAGQYGHAKARLDTAKHAGIGCAIVLVVSSILSGSPDMLSSGLLGTGLAASIAQLLPWLSLGSVAGRACAALDAANTQRAAIKLSKADITMHRRLYLMAHDALRSDYRRRPDAGLFAKLALDMAALVNPAALEHWEDRLTSRWEVDRELADLAKALADQRP